MYNLIYTAFSHSPRFAVSDVDTATLKAERVIDRIRAKNIRTIRQNELYKICRCTLFRNANDFNETIIMLEEYGYIKRKTVQGANGNNKSSIVLHVNPLIYNSRIINIFSTIDTLRKKPIMSIMLKVHKSITMILFDWY